MKNKTFKPAWWLGNPHCQTLWPFIFRTRIKKEDVTRERFELPDGDFIDLDWAGKSNGPIVFIFHGLEGSSQSHYAKGLLRCITQKGWRGLFVHFRGCSGEHNRLPRSYHSGDTGDIGYLINTIHQREPHIRLAAIAISLGSNALLKWLGETGSKNPLSAAIAISVPFDLYQSVKHMEKGFARLYQWHLVKQLRHRLSKKFQLTPPAIPAHPLSSIKTIFHIDDHITAPLHGFKDAKEYYALSSCKQFLKNIQIPTLIIHAKDDPFIPAHIIPSANELSPFIQLELSENGGHVGFVSGAFPGYATYWLEERIPVFLKEHF